MLRQQREQVVELRLQSLLADDEGGVRLHRRIRWDPRAFVLRKELVEHFITTKTISRSFVHRVHYNLTTLDQR